MQAILANKTKQLMKLYAEDCLARSESQAAVCREILEAIEKQPESLMTDCSPQQAALTDAIATQAACAIAYANSSASTEAYSNLYETAIEDTAVKAEALFICQNPE